MWSPRDTPEPIEKIRKPQWTVENTRKTQHVVDGLRVGMFDLITVTGGDTALIRHMLAVIARIKELDPKVK